MRGIFLVTPPEYRNTEGRQRRGEGGRPVEVPEFRRTCRRGRGDRRVESSGAPGFRGRTALIGTARVQRVSRNPGGQGSPRTSRSKLCRRWSVPEFRNTGGLA